MRVVGRWVRKVLEDRGRGKRKRGEVQRGFNVDGKTKRRKGVMGGAREDVQKLN